LRSCGCPQRGEACAFVIFERRSGGGAVAKKSVVEAARVVVEQRFFDALRLRRGDDLCRHGCFFSIFSRISDRRNALMAGAVFLPAPSDNTWPAYRADGRGAA
jgi:hypothetical protein